jgi:hypothetical protein
MSLKNYKCSKKGLNEKTIKVVFNLLNEKFEMRDKYNNHANLKEEVKKVFNESNLINSFLKSDKFINKEKFIDLVCILLPENKEITGGADEEVVKFENPRYFNYDKKWFKYDVLAIGSFIITLILIYISYVHFSELVGDAKVLVNYNKIITEKKLQIDGASMLAFFRYAYHLIHNTLCSTGENIFTYIKNEIISLEMKTLQDINTKCYVNVDNSYYLNSIFKSIQMFYNPTGSQTCAMEVLNHNLLMEIHTKIHELTLTKIRVNDVFIYSYRAIQLGVPAVSYLTVRLGLRALPRKEVKPASPKTQHSHDTRASRKQKMIQNTTMGGRNKTQRRRKA